MNPVSVRTKVWLEAGGTFALGEGALALFDGLDRYANLTRAAGDIGWSYRHAWGYLRRAERALGCKLTVTTPGKGRRRGMQLTPVARVLLRQLAEARGRVRAAAVSPGEGGGVSRDDDLTARPRPRRAAAP